MTHGPAEGGLYHQHVLKGYFETSGNSSSDQTDVDEMGWMLELEEGLEIDLDFTVMI